MYSKTPNFHSMIIGSMKCGTTSLFYYLKEHPEICSSIIKEPEFFSENQCHGLNISKYEHLFEFNGDKHLVTLEASTGYTKYPTELNVPYNIFKYGLNPKFIYVLRNPFERIISHITFLNGKSHMGITEKFIDTSNYKLQLDHFMKFFPRDRFLIIDMDDLVTNPKQVMSNISDFLEISRIDYPIEYKVYNPSQIGKKRILTEQEYERIYKSLYKNMQELRNEFNINVSKWGF